MPILLSHPNQNTLEGYAMNHLAERQVGLVEEHLLCCERCQTSLTGLDEEIAVMRLALN
jgi:hypothetical protein